MDLKGIAIFGIIAVVVLFAASQLQQSFTNEVNENQEEIKTNREIQLESRDIANEYRNLTLDLLNNLTEKVNENSIRIGNLEENLIIK